MAKNEVDRLLEDVFQDIKKDEVEEIKKKLQKYAQELKGLVEQIEVYLKRDTGHEIKQAYKNGGNEGAKEKFSSIMNIYIGQKNQINIDNFYRTVVKKYYKIRKDMTGETIKESIFINLTDPESKKTIWKENTEITLDQLLETGIGTVNFDETGNANISITNKQMRELNKKITNNRVKSYNYGYIFDASKSLIDSHNQAGKENYNQNQVTYIQWSNGTVAETIKRLNIKNRKTFFNEYLKTGEWEKQLDITSKNTRSGALGPDTGDWQVKASSLNATFKIGNLDELARKVRKFYKAIEKLSNKHQLQKLIEIFFLNNKERVKMKTDTELQTYVKNKVEKTLKQIKGLKIT